MKLKDWADKQGISYLTAWRWFKAGDPRLADAYQSDSGTIIVPDEYDASSEQQMLGNTSNDVMSAVLKKTVELSKTNGTIEDFAAWVLSNYSLKPHTHYEGPKYTRNKPKSEEVQKHFQKFMKPKGEKPKPNMFVAEPEALDDLVARSDDMTTQELVEEIHQFGTEVGAPVNPTDTPEVKDLMKDLSLAMATSAVSLPNNVTTYDDVATKYGYDDVTEGVVTRSVDLTPQQLNYTGSSVSTLSSVAFNAAAGEVLPSVASASLVPPQVTTGFIKYGDAVPAAAPAVYVSNSFGPTQKELEGAIKVSGLADSRPKRGRKPSKNLGNK
jgi:hypothetical protein